jgi:hypothetical protein
MRDVTKTGGQVFPHSLVSHLFHFNKGVSVMVVLIITRKESTMVQEESFSSLGEAISFLMGQSMTGQLDLVFSISIEEKEMKNNEQ